MTIEEVFRKLRPVIGPKLDALWQEYLVADADIRQTIERTLRVTLAQRLSETFESEHILLRPPPRHLAAGEYPVGTIHYGERGFYPFGLREEEFIQHIGIFGRSGSGKTNLAYLLLRGLVAADKPFLVFDWKRNYRDLVRDPRFADLIVFTVGRGVAPFRFNPLVPPPGTPATVWLKKLIEIMCHAYFLGEGVTVLLMRAIDHLYRQAGLYAGPVHGYPTMTDVRDYLAARKSKGREAGWMESAMRAVEVLCFGEMGRVLNSPESFDIAGLLNRCVILELDALTNADKTFLIESLLLWIHHYRMGQEGREGFRHAIIIEEAHHILLRKKQEATGEETVTDVLLREIRELGESIICLDQHPSLISKPALGNTYTTFAFNLKHRGDIAMIQDCLHLDGEQAGYLGRLEVGWAVVRLQGRWFLPFLIRLPLVSISKGTVTDQAIRERWARICVRRRLPKAGEGCSEAISASQGDSVAESSQDGGIPVVSGEGKEDENRQGCAIRLTTRDKAFLKDVLEHAGSTTIERYERLGLSRRCGNDVKRVLVHSKCIDVHSVSALNGRVKILTLTDQGRAALGLGGDESDRHGGPEHRYWAKRVADHLRACGYEVAEEVPVGGGKTVDLVASRSSKRIAFEIETGKSDALANVNKCLEADVEAVVLLATSARVKQQLSRQIPSNHRVTVTTAGAFLHMRSSREYLGFRRRAH